MSLPTDILDRILSFLQDDRTALRACSQSHPTVSQLAERYLYAHITVDNDGAFHSDNTHHFGVGNKVTVLLSKRPHIANYVRSLEIRVSYKSTPAKVTLSEDLFAVLSSFPLLTTITLSAHPDVVKWRLLPEDFRKAFIGCLRLFSINSVSIIRVPGFPLSVLNDCNGITDFTVESWRNGVDLIAEDANLPLLGFLSIKHCGGESLAKLITWAPIRNLRTLELSRLHNVLGYTKVPELLAKCSDSLSTLDLDLGSECAVYALSRRFLLIFATVRSHSHYGTSDDAVYQPLPSFAIPFTLSSLTQLEHLVIRANLDFLFYDDYTFGSSLPALTSLIKTASSLKHLTFAFNFHLNKWVQIPKASEFICIPLVGLLKESRSVDISLHIGAICDSGREFDAPFLEVIVSVLTGCAEVNQLVEQGVLVIIPDTAAIPSAEQLSPSKDSTTSDLPGAQPPKASRKWLTRSLAFFDSSRSTRRQGE